MIQFLSRANFHYIIQWGLFYRHCGWVIFILEKTCLSFPKNIKFCKFNLWPEDCCEGRRVVEEAVSAADWEPDWWDCLVAGLGLCWCPPALLPSSSLRYSVWPTVSPAADWCWLVLQQTLVYICRLRRGDSTLQWDRPGLAKTGRNYHPQLQTRPQASVTVQQNYRN